MTDPEGYWSILEKELDRLTTQNEADESDPWARLDLSAPGLTPEQRAALADQPRQPTLSDTAPVLEGEALDASDGTEGTDATGKPPGAPDDDVA